MGTETGVAIFLALASTAVSTATTKQAAAKTRGERRKEAARQARIQKIKVAREARRKAAILRAGFGGSGVEGTLAEGAIAGLQTSAEQGFFDIEEDTAAQGRQYDIAYNAASNEATADMIRDLGVIAAEVYKYESAPKPETDVTTPSKD